MKNVYRVACILLSVLLLVSFAGCSGQTQAPSSSATTTPSSAAPSAQAPATLAKVRVGMPPYPMYQVFAVAQQMGIDKAFGIELELMPFASSAPASQALTRGDLDISANCIAEHLAAIKGSPTLVNFTPLGNFKGFFFVGRKGQIKPWDELVKELGVEEAKKARLNEFKGKTFCIIPQRKPLIVDAISQVGLTENDVKFMNFGDDAKAATAYLSGTGDFYIGGLAQQRSLCQQEDKFVNAGGADILGPAGLWFDTMITTDKFLNDKETALRTLAVMFASINAFDKDPMGYSEIAAKSFTKLSGTETPTEEWHTFMTEFDDLVSVGEAKDGFYNKNDKLYWKNAVEYNINALVADGTLDKSVLPEQYYGGGESLFFELLERQDLLDLIDQYA